MSVNPSSSVPTSPRSEFSRWLLPATIFIAAVTWLTLVMISFSAAFDAPLRDLTSASSGAVYVVALAFCGVLAVGAAVIRAGHVPALPVVIGAAGVVVAASLPVHWWVGGPILAVAGLAVVGMRQPRGSLVVRVPVGAVAALSAVAVSLVGASQWGRDLRAHPLDPPPAPVFLSLLVSSTEGALDIDGSTRCVVRLGELFLDPADTDSYLWLGDDAAWTFVVRPCADISSS